MCLYPISNRLPREIAAVDAERLGRSEQPLYNFYICKVTFDDDRPGALLANQPRGLFGIAFRA
jgi:hypothetical protein